MHHAIQPLQTSATPTTNAITILDATKVGTLLASCRSQLDVIIGIADIIVKSALIDWNANKAQSLRTCLLRFVTAAQHAGTHRQGRHFSCSRRSDCQRVLGVFTTPA